MFRARQNVTARMELDERLPATEADPAQLHRALQNLALNALDAMPTGGVLTIRTAHDPSAGAHEPLGPGKRQSCSRAASRTGLRQRLRISAGPRAQRTTRLAARERSERDSSRPGSRRRPLRRERVSSRELSAPRIRKIGRARVPRRPDIGSISAGPDPSLCDVVADAGFVLRPRV